MDIFAGIFTFILVILAIWGVPAMLCYYIAQGKGHNPAIGALIGILIGYIGVLIYAVIPYSPEVSRR